jgi:signal peptidase I
MKTKNLKAVAATILTLVILVIVAAVGLAKPYYLSGDCMEPTVRDGQWCFLNQVSPYLRKYRINDIILFTHEKKVWISRIVAIENDVIKINNGHILVNHVALENTTIHRNWRGWECGTYAIKQPFQVPTGHVFVLSDNLSAQHDDSRVFGPIPNSVILGTVW